MNKLYCNDTVYATLFDLFKGSSLNASLYERLTYFWSFSKVEVHLPPLKGNKGCLETTIHISWCRVPT